MPVRRKTAKNRRRKKSNRRYFWVSIIIAIVVIIIGAVFSQVRFKDHIVQVPAEKRRTEEKLKMPQRPVGQPAVLEDYSAAVTSRSEATPPRKPKKVGKGTVAIIVDDMGSSLHEAETLLAMDVPLTFSIIPGLAKGRAVAEAAHRKGCEVMVHIPMEPKEYLQKPFEKNGLLLAQSDDEIQKRVEGFLGSIPHAVGANNHMGSRFTEDRRKMLIVLKVLKAKGLYFVDSKTSPASVGDSVARELGVSVASRNVFLDNEQDVAAIRAQLNKLAELARKSGSAIGICHPHKTTLQALADALPALKNEGINFVYASALVK